MCCLLLKERYGKHATFPTFVDDESKPKKKKSNVVMCYGIRNLTQSHYRDSALNELCSEYVKFEIYMNYREWI